MGHTLTDNRHGLIASAMVTTADGHAEREASKVMVGDARQAQGDPAIEITLGADKGYDAKEFIEHGLALVQGVFQQPAGGLSLKLRPNPNCAFRRTTFGLRCWPTSMRCSRSPVRTVSEPDEGASLMGTGQINHHPTTPEISVPFGECSVGGDC